MTITELIARLRARTVPNWVHGTGCSPRMSGHKPDPDCILAAELLSSMDLQLSMARTALAGIAAPWTADGAGNRCQALAHTTLLRMEET
jgi:hypothetical protein